MLLVALVCREMRSYFRRESVESCLDLFVLLEERVVLFSGWAHGNELVFVGGDSGFVFCFERAGNVGGSGWGVCWGIGSWGGSHGWRLAGKVWAWAYGVILGGWV